MILIIDMNHKPHSLGFFEFVLPLVQVVKALDNFTVKHFDELKDEDVKSCDAILLSGTPLKDTATLSQLEKFQWMKTCNKPILGICAGMQTIGLVFGLGLKKCVEIGMMDVKTLRDNPLFSSTFQAYTLHNYSIAQSGKFVVIAESHRCVQAIRHRQKEVYGVLFHPEVRNQEILQRFVCMFDRHRRV